MGRVGISIFIVLISICIRPDFYIKIGIAGVPTDSTMKKTKVIEDNWSPVWNEEFEFPLTVPELALLRIEVHEFDISDKDDFGGQTCLPVWELKTGLRAATLHDHKGDKYRSVLSDPQRRAVYDQYGEDGLKGQVPPPDAGGFSGMRDGSGQTFRFNPFSADDIFSSPFLGFSSPFLGMGDMGSGSRMGGSGFPRGAFGDDLFASFRNVAGGEGGSGGAPRKAAAIEWMLPCSLEDLYKGTTKKMKISRDVVDSSGRRTMEEIRTIEIKPGWKKGTKITFPEMGNEQPGVIPSDLVFIIDEKPHSVFKRDGNDLIVTQKISLVEALVGYTALVTTLDGRNLTIPINSIVSPTNEEVVKGEGMPIPKEPSKRGNLRIKFNIKFPSRLTTEQKTGIKRPLTSS